MKHGSGPRAPISAAPHLDADGPNEATSVANPHELRFAIRPRRILHMLLMVIAIQVVLSTAGQAMVLYLPDFPLRNSIASVLYVGSEQSLPTLYSTMTLLVAALLFGILAYGHRRGGRAYVRHWAALSLVFALLAFDEFGQLHEQAGEPLRARLNIEGGPLMFAWVIPGAIVTALFAMIFLRFLRHLPRATRRRLSAAGALYVGGAIGGEMLGAWYDSAVQGVINMTYVLLVTIEEALEMLGIAVIVYALLAYIPMALPNVEWRFRVAALD